MNVYTGKGGGWIVHAALPLRLPMLTFFTGMDMLLPLSATATLRLPPPIAPPFASGAMTSCSSAAVAAARSTLGDTGV